jgi:hypothetical protein
MERHDFYRFTLFVLISGEGIEKTHGGLVERRTPLPPWGTEWISRTLEGLLVTTPIRGKGRMIRRYVRAIRVGG